MSYDPRQVVFLDTETTGLDVERHEVWELAYIYWDTPDGDTGHFVEKVLHFFPRELWNADPVALRINHFWEWYNLPLVKRVEPRTDEELAKFVQRVDGKHVVGAVPDFDTKFLNKLLTYNALPQNPWHYHLIDVEALMVGYLCGTVEENNLHRKEAGESPYDYHAPLPWRSKELSEEIGVPFIEEFGKAHTALADTRWAKATFEKIMGEPVVLDKEVSR